MPKITWIFIDIAKFLLQILTGQWQAFYCTDEECKGVKDKNIEKENENAYNLKNYLEKFKDNLKLGINAMNK